MPIRTDADVLLRGALSLFFLFLFTSCGPEKDKISTPVEQTAERSAEQGSSDGDKVSPHGDGPTEGSGVSSGNVPPRITRAAIKFGDADNRDFAKAVVEATDSDNDTVTFRYEWFKNGQFAGDGDTVTGFKRGDKLHVKITPFDGKDYGQMHTGTLTVRNLNPRIIENREARFDGKMYFYQVKAADPDGDALAYSLKSGPERMTIDASTGLIRWTVPREFLGKVTVTVVIKDDHGGGVTFPFEVLIEPEKK